MSRSLAAARERKGAMSVYKRGGHWHFTKTINGVRYRGALKMARTKAQAEEDERKELDRIRAGSYRQNPYEEKTVENFCSRHVSPVGQGVEEVVAERCLASQGDTSFLRQMPAEGRESISSRKLQDPTPKGAGDLPVQDRRNLRATPLCGGGESGAATPISNFHGRRLPISRPPPLVCNARRG